MGDVFNCGWIKVGELYFTETVGTIFEDSHVPLNKWLLAIHLLCPRKRYAGASISSLEIPTNQLGLFVTASDILR
jgi:hypothetical protein